VGGIWGTEYVARETIPTRSSRHLIRHKKINLILRDSGKGKEEVPRFLTTNYSQMEVRDHLQSMAALRARK